MENLSKGNTLKAFFSLLVLSLMQVIAFAQDKVVIKTTQTETHTWYAEPWVWIVGGVALVLLLAAIFSGKNKTTITTTRTIE